MKEDMKTTLTKEQSAQLIELGVDPKIASEEVIENISQAEYNEPRPKVFTLADILSILPKKITDRRHIYELRIGVAEDEQWFVKYVNTHNDSDDLETWISDSELIDAIHKEICLLKTSNIQQL